MVCYARPAFRVAVIIVGALLVFGRPLGHLPGTAEFVVAAAAVAGTVAAGCALVFAAFMSTRRRRAASGGCVSCRFRCQHAMTESTAARRSRLWLVATTDRGPTVGGPPRASGPGTVPGPRWPDQPRLLTKAR